MCQYQFSTCLGVAATSTTECKAINRPTEERCEAAVRAAASSALPLACCELFRQSAALCHGLKRTLYWRAGRVGGGGGKVQADKFGLFRCSGKFQDGCVCVRAVEGHASQLSRGINRHVNAKRRAGRFLFTTDKCAFSQQHPPPQPHHHPKKKVVFKSVSSHAFTITRGLFTRSGQFKITPT